MVSVPAAFGAVAAASAASSSARVAAALIVGAAVCGVAGPVACGSPCSGAVPALAWVAETAAMMSWLVAGVSGRDAVAASGSVLRSSAPPVTRQALDLRWSSLHGVTRSARCERSCTSSRRRQGCRAVAATGLRGVRDKSAKARTARFTTQQRQATHGRHPQRRYRPIVNQTLRIGDEML